MEWYYNSVEYVVKHGYFAGTGDNTFSPAAPMTRAMFVTVLSRLDGVTVSDAVSPFEDVPAGAWYEGEAAWAVDNELVSGVGGSNFAPEQNVTRQQMAALMVRYIAYYTEKNKTEIEATEAAKAFTDADEIASYAKDAAALCCSYGLIGGYPDGSFDPTGTATHSQVAAVIYRLALLLVIGETDTGNGLDTGELSPIPIKSPEAARAAEEAVVRAAVLRPARLLPKRLPTLRLRAKRTVSQS